PLRPRTFWLCTPVSPCAAVILSGASFGAEPQSFHVGGFATLRGYPDFDLVGTRMAIVNAELRFPFIQQLVLVGPVPLGSFNLKGAVFSDAGIIWNDTFN